MWSDQLGDNSFSSGDPCSFFYMAIMFLHILKSGGYKTLIASVKATIVCFCRLELTSDAQAGQF